MISKTIFLVLLGTALVLANPIPERNIKDVFSVIPSSENTVEHGIFQDRALDNIALANFFDDDEEEIGNTSALVIAENKWSKLKQKWDHLIENAKDRWANIKGKLNNLKKKGLVFIEEAKETYDEIKVHGKKAVAEFNEIYKIFKAKWNTLKCKGADVYDEISDIIDELKQAVNTVRQTWTEVKQIG